MSIVAFIIYTHTHPQLLIGFLVVIAKGYLLSDGFQGKMMR
jgi:hypothetical protein